MSNEIEQRTSDERCIPFAWQPIDTAPRNGESLLLAKIAGHFDHPTSVWWMVQGCWSIKWNKWWDGIEPCGLAGPTHWMPVPGKETRIYACLIDALTREPGESLIEWEQRARATRELLRQESKT